MAGNNAVTELFKDERFRQLAFYSTLVIIKMFFVQLFTTFYRLTKHVYVNVEDVKAFAGEKKDVTVKYDDVDVERVRRCHLNDIENILPFILLGLFYVCSGPTSFVARTVFQIFTASRIMFTVAYLMPLPAPSRTLCFVVGFGCQVFMAINILTALF